MALSAGTFLGPYEVEGPLGAGGMGEVYRARDPRLGRTVAIKILNDEVACQADARARFEREARAVAALSHPHICAIYDVSPNYFVMELVEGQPLAGPLPLGRVIEFASQILSALDAAHRAGITHRDLKPDNILITRQGVKLVDFGLARQSTAVAADVPSQNLTHPPSQFPTMQHTLTGELTIIGTVQYMSPEQAQGKPADARSDIFSFGLLLYEMVTGKRPFDGPNPASVIAAILERDVPSLPGAAPPALNRVLQRCVAKDPEERWQSARDVSHALALAGDAPAAVRSGLASRGTLVAASLFAILAAAIAVPLWSIWPRDQDERRPLSFNLAPPGSAEFQFTPNGGGSVISPDGRSVAFVAVTNGTPQLWIRGFDSLTARVLPDSDGAKLPFWSPDSGALGFFTSTDLRRIDVTGAAAVVIARTLDARGATWNGDGTVVFSPNSVGGLYRVSAAGGTPTPLTTVLAAGESHRWPRFLPDGRTLLYFVQGTEPGVYLTTLDRPAVAKRVLTSASDAAYVPSPEGTGPGQLLWVAGDVVMARRFDPQSGELMGSAVAVPGTGGVASSVATQRNSMSVSNDGTLLYSSGGSRYQLAWFGRDGTPRGTVGASDQYIGLRLSPDGREVLVTIRDTAANGDLWRIDLSSGARSRVTSEGGGWYAVWSPDSQQVAFTALNRRDVLQAADARGDGELRELFSFDVQAYPSDWSLDGNFLAYTASTRDRSNDVWLLSMLGSRKATPLLQSTFAERHAQFSPDGKWVAFTSNENGRDDVYVQSFPDATVRRTLSSAGGAYPRWGATGRELFYRAPDGYLIAIPFRVAGAAVELGPPSSVMRLVDAAGVHPYPYDVTADGRILAMTPASGNVQDLTLTVLMNWQSGLER